MRLFGRLVSSDRCRIVSGTAGDDIVFIRDGPPVSLPSLPPGVLEAIRRYCMIVLIEQANPEDVSLEHARAMIWSGLVAVWSDRQSRYHVRFCGVEEAQFVFSADGILLPRR